MVMKVCGTVEEGFTKSWKKVSGRLMEVSHGGFMVDLVPLMSKLSSVKTIDADTGTAICRCMIS